MHLIQKLKKFRNNQKFGTADSNFDQAIEECVKLQFSSASRPIVKLQNNLTSLLKAKYEQLETHANRIKRLETSTTNIAVHVQKVSDMTNKGFKSLQIALNALWQNNLSYNRINFLTSQRSETGIESDCSSS